MKKMILVIGLGIVLLILMTRFLAIDTVETVDRRIADAEVKVIPPMK